MTKIFFYLYNSYFNIFRRKKKIFYNFFLINFTVAASPTITVAGRAPKKATGGAKAVPATGGDAEAYEASA